MGAVPDRSCASRRKAKAQCREEYKLQAALADAKPRFVSSVTLEAQRAYGDRY